MGKKNTLNKENKMIPPESQQNSPQMNPMTMMSQMMASFQSMMAGQGTQQWAQPFQENTMETPEEVSHNIILPKTIDRGIVTQQGLDVHPLYSKLFMDNENNLLNGIPSGCTITLTGPSYIGKTRSALEMIIRAVMKDIKTAYVVAEEGFIDTNDTGRNDLFSRFLTMAVNISELSENEFREKYDEKYFIIPNQYHLGKTWNDFIDDYRYAVETLDCKFIIIDSINMLDPSKRNTVDNLNALKTYNHEKGVTCLVIGQIKDTGLPQGGEALFHTSEVAIHFYEYSLGSKDEAARWGGKYREKITLVASKSKVCKPIAFPIRVDNNEGMIRPHIDQPKDHEFPDGFWDDLF